MDFAQHIQSKLANLSAEDKRLLTELADFLAARRAKRRTESDNRPDDWSALSLEAMFAGQNHPDEVDYSLEDISRTVDP